MPYLLDVDLPRGYYSGRPAAAARLGLPPAAPTARAAAYFNVVWSNLLRLTFHDELPEDAVARRRRPLVRGGRAGCCASPPTPWWDDAAPTGSRPATTSCAEAMTDARDELTRREAVDPDEWTWGRLHRLDLHSQTLGESGHRPGRVAGQPRRLEGRRRRRGRRRDRRGTPPRATRSTTRAVDADGRLARRPRRLPLDQPDRRLRAPVRRALHRPDRPVGRRARPCRGCSHAASAVEDTSPGAGLPSTLKPVTGEAAGLHSDSRAGRLDRSAAAARRGGGGGGDRAVVRLAGTSRPTSSS